MQVRFAVIGDSFVDVVAGTLTALPAWGGDAETSHPIQLRPGGSALNTATHLANINHSVPTYEVVVDLHSAIGNDSFGEVLRSHLQRKKINLVVCSKELEESPTAVCVVLSGPDDRSFVSHYGAVRKLSVEHLDQSRILSANHIHIGGFYCCENLRNNLHLLLERAHERGITVSLDTNYDATGTWQHVVELLPLIDVFMPNEHEAMRISGTGSVEEALAFFATRVRRLVVIKTGHNGVVAKDCKTQQVFRHSVFATAMVDATGAGDSFNAGFLSAWKVHCEHDVYQALGWGCATASRCVMALGACSKEIRVQDIELLVNQRNN